MSNPEFIGTDNVGLLSSTHIHQRKHVVDPPSLYSKLTDTPQSAGFSNITVRTYISLAYGQIYKEYYIKTYQQSLLNTLGHGAVNFNQRCTAN